MAGVVSTDKVDTEIPSPADGILARIAGDGVAVGTRLAWISAMGPAGRASSRMVAG